jgi:hypothetical protein
MNHRVDDRFSHRVPRVLRQFPSTNSLDLKTFCRMPFDEGDRAFNGFGKVFVNLGLIKEAGGV